MRAGDRYGACPLIPAKPESWPKRGWPGKKRREAMNRKMHNQGVRFALASLLLIFGIAWGSPAWPWDQTGGTPAPTGVTYSGRAFAAFVNVPTLGVGPTTVSDTGELPPSGGFQSADFATVGAPGVLNATLLSASTSGANGVARSRASLADFVALPGNAAQVTASFAQAESEATRNGGRGSTEVVNETFAGQAIAVDPFAPNQMFEVPGVAKLVINEQKTASGGGTQDITVNAIHLTVTADSVVTAEVIVSSAHSDVQGCPGCPPKPPCSTDFMTGGGWIKVGSATANFGFNAGYKPNSSTPEI